MEALQASRSVFEGFRLPWVQDTLENVSTGLLGPFLGVLQPRGC